MNRRAVLVIAVIALVGLVSMPALAAQTVTATGTAAILNRDAAQARDRAVENALRSAVEQVVGTLVDSETLVQNSQLLSDKIFTQTTGYISNYKIVKERPDTETNIYSVTVEATVKEGNLQDDLNSMGLLMRRMKMPRICVAIQEIGWTASTQLQQMLKDKGFLVVDTGERFHNEQFVREFWGMSETSQTDLLKQYGAEVVILGSALGRAGSNVGNTHMISYQANVAIRALKTDTKEILGSASGSGTAVHVGDAGLAQALKQATTLAGNDLIRQVTKQWSTEVTSSRMLILEVRGTSAGEAEVFAKKLRQHGRGIQDVVVREVSGGTATLGVTMQGDASDLAQEVAKIFPTKRILEKTANRLTVGK
jgi:hypothetical protein